jgi:hypothetical protein
MAGFKQKKTRAGFSRPLLDLDRTHSAREWKYVPAGDLIVGDTVSGFGVVVSTQPTCRDEVVLEVGLPDTKTHFLNAGTEYFAFVKKEN